MHNLFVQNYPRLPPVHRIVVGVIYCEQDDLWRGEAASLRWNKFLKSQVEASECGGSPIALGTIIPA